MARHLETICGDHASTTGICPWPKAWHSRNGCTFSCAWTPSIRLITHTSMLLTARSAARDLVRLTPPDPNPAVFFSLRSEERRVGKELRREQEEEHQKIRR